jgi:hypothetical protein
MTETRCFPWNLNLKTLCALLSGSLLLVACETEDDEPTSGRSEEESALRATVQGSAFAADSSAWFGQAVGTTVTIEGLQNDGEQVLTLKIADQDTGAYQIREQITGDQTATLTYEDGDATMQADTGEVFISRFGSTYIDGSFNAPDNQFFVSGGRIDSVRRQ